MALVLCYMLNICVCCPVISLDDDNAIFGYYETAVLTFYLFNLSIGVGILASLIQFSRFNIRPSESTVLDTLRSLSDPKIISYNKIKPNSHDNWKHVENVDNIFCKNEEDFFAHPKRFANEKCKKGYNWEAQCQRDFK